VLVVMLISFESSLSRELIVFTDHHDLGEALVHYLFQSELDLALLRGEAALDPSEAPAAASDKANKGEQDQAPNHTTFYLFSQNNTKSSRKTLQPLIHSILENLSPKSPSAPLSEPVRKTFTSEERP